MGVFSTFLSNYLKQLHFYSFNRCNSNFQMFLSIYMWKIKSSFGSLFCSGLEDDIPF